MHPRDYQLGDHIWLYLQLHENPQESIIWTYSKGVHFWVNAGFRQHPWPGHILHISKDEQVRFEAIVNTHPNIGPLPLIVGVPAWGVNGPVESIADICEHGAGRKGASQDQERRSGWWWRRIPFCVREILPRIPRFCDLLATQHRHRYICPIIPYANREG